MGHERRLRILLLGLVAVLAASVAVLAWREAQGRAQAHSPDPEPLWLRYLEADLAPQDALWVLHADECRAARREGRSEDALREARAALEVASGFPPGDERRKSSLRLLEGLTLASNGDTPRAP